MKLNLAIVLSLATVCTSTAFGDTISFTGSNTILPHSQVYNPGPNSVTAYAFDIGGGSRLLYGKNGGGSENGVGISGNRDNEITSTSFIQLDLANISGPYSLLIGSTQLVEGFKACFGNTLGAVGGSCQDFAIPGADPLATPNFSKAAGQYVSIQADGTGNVLLDSLTFSRTSPVPEPNSLFLLGTGMVGIAGVLRRKLSA